MPIYEIEQYELHVQTYRVEAVSEVEAIKRLYAGEADAVDNSLDFVEVADEYGLPVEEFRELAQALQSLGESFDDDVIPSIRSVLEVDE